MKKIYKLFIFILFVPVFAKADIGAPSIRPFDAVVTDPNGIEAECDLNDIKHYNQGDVLKIHGNNDYYLTETDKKTCLIDKKYNNSFKPLTDAVGPNDSGVSKLNEASTYMAAFDDVKVLKGPASAYESIGTLKKGDIVTSYYYIDGLDAYNEFFYIEKDNIKGWINVSKHRDDKTEFWKKTKENIQVIFKGTTTVDDYTFNANSTYNVAYWSDSYLSRYAVLEINNKLYSLPEDKYSLFSEDPNIKYNFKKMKIEITLSNSVKMYTTAEYKEELTTIPANTTLESINLINVYYDAEDNFQEDFYVSYDGKKGWIKINKDNIVDIHPKYEETTSVKTTTTTYYDDYVPYHNDNNEDYDTEDEEDDTLEELRDGIITFVIFAVSISILAVGAIILINKKRKKKTPEEEAIISNNIQGDTIESDVKFVENESTKEDNIIGKKEGNDNEEDNKNSNN